MHLLFALFLLPFGALHFLPTIVAAIRQSRHTMLIFFLNLLLGWTVIGWVLLLVWAGVGETKYDYRYGYPRYGRWF